MSRRITGLAPVFVGLGLLLGACTGPEQPIRYYMLAPAQLTPAAVLGDQVVLGIGPVTVPRHLDRPEVVRRATANRVTLLEFDHWAEPLDEAIQRVMGRNMETLLGLQRVENFPWTRGRGVTHQLTLDILTFDQAPDGEVHMDVRWKLLDAETDAVIAGRTTQLRVTVVDGSVDAMVEGLSAALGELGRESTRAF